MSRIEPITPVLPINNPPKREPQQQPEKPKPNIDTTNQDEDPERWDGLA